MNRDRSLPALACDVCPTPGVCCKDMHLSNAGGGAALSFWIDEGGSRLMALVQMAKEALPFIPLEGEPGEHEGRRYIYFRVACPELRGDGRCGIYEHRPALCRSYQAGDDALCVHGKKG